MGLSLLVSAWLFFRVTGGLFNPNVSVALLLSGIITPVRCILYCIAQLVGGIAAAGLVLALTPGSLASKCVDYLPAFDSALTSCAALSSLLMSTLLKGCSSRCSLLAHSASQC
jgi:glycerol uptake facilitator-like aquaporin